MFFTRALKWLTFIGALAASYITLPKFWINLGGGRVFKLEQDLPLWALGLGVVIVGLLVFKVITHIIFKFLMWGALIVIAFLVLSGLNVPVWQWLHLAN